MENRKTLDDTKRDENKGKKQKVNGDKHKTRVGTKPLIVGRRSKTNGEHVAKKKCGSDDRMTTEKQEWKE